MELDNLMQRHGHVGVVDGTGNRSNSCVVTPKYGPLYIGKEEPVNLHFGYFVISSWPDHTSGASHANSTDDNKGNNRYSPFSNSPKHSDGPVKELSEESLVPSKNKC